MINIGPKNLFNRFLLIIIVPIFLLLAVSTYIFYERHWENVLARMQDSLINDIRLLVELGQIDEELMLNAGIMLDVEINIKHGSEALIFSTDNLHKPDYELKSFNSRLTIRSNKVTKSYYLKDSSRIRTLVYDQDNLFIFTYSNKKIHSPTTIVFIMWMAGTAILLVTIAITFMKNQIRAISSLATAADRLGKGQETSGFRPSGAIEVRVAGKAFLRMKERIERQISYRTELLAHISHDLRTPLTRMKLQLALMKNRKKAKHLEQDILEMEKMIEGYITFAKEEGNEPAVQLNLVKTATDAIEKFMDKRITFECPLTSYAVSLRREAFNRVIWNLLSNAQKHCQNKIHVSLSFTRAHFYFVVEDDGKGIPEIHYDKVFTPFTKLDKKINGFGLGLAIVKNIVLSHGGNIKLMKSDLGGLKVSIKIPT